MPKKTSVTGEKTKGLFDFIRIIQEDQRLTSFDELSDVEKKTYKNSKYMIHRFLSMQPSYAPIVNAIQKYTNIPARAHYQFLTSILPKGKQYNKYIKAATARGDEYEDWLIQLVVKHYEVSINTAVIYLNIYYASNRDELKTLCETYAVDPKLIKKAKL
jgi:hypothetical protein